MTRIKLYTGGGVSLSPQNAEGRTESDFVRLVADESMMLTHNGRYATVVDVHKTDVDNWNEVTYVEPDEEAEAEDYENSLADLGVRFGD